MDLTFDLGSPDQPAGHALIYFTAAGDTQVLATYVLVLPISMHLEKYMPPAFQSLIPGGELNLETATAMPPVAEEVESVDWLRALASSRRDDLVDAGELYSSDLPNLIQMTQEAATHYGELYSRQEPVAASVVVGSFDAYADLTEAERLNELTKLVGRLRDSLGTSESVAAESECRTLAATLPPKYRAEDLVESALKPGEVGQRLAMLHLQRSYKLLSEEYLDVAEIERQIRELESS